MAALDRLLKVGSLAESVGVYALATGFQKAIGMGRLLLFVHMLAKQEVQYNLWAAGAMVFDLAAPLVCLGSSSGLGRYVSYYEARGQLVQFYRRVRWGVVFLSLTLTLVALLGSDWIRAAAIASREASSQVPWQQQMMVCWAALANVFVMALYLNMLSLLYGLRVYRLISTIEIFFSFAFTIIGLLALLHWPSGLTLLLAHFASLALTIVVGTTLVHRGLRTQWQGPPPQGEPMPLAVETPSEADEIGPTVAVGESSLQPGATDGFAKVLQFGLVAMISNVVWTATGYISYRLTSYQDESAGAVFQSYLRLDQQVVFLANAAWAVVFSHVARRWENRQRASAMQTLETSYKAVAMATMTLSILLYATVPWWVHVLPAKFHSGQVVVGGLLMFFQVLTHLSLMNIVAKLKERPIVMVLGALAGGTSNLLLALWWMPSGPAQDVMKAAALAAGVGMYVGGGLVTVLYFWRARISIHPSTWFVFFLPAILLLPALVAAAVWAVVLAATLLSDWVFDQQQKRRLTSAVAGLWMSATKKR